MDKLSVSMNTYIDISQQLASCLFFILNKQLKEQKLHWMQCSEWNITSNIESTFCGLFSWRCIKLVAHTYRSKTVPRISLGFLYLFYYCSLIFSKISIAIFSFQILKLLLLMLVSKEYWQKMGLNCRSLRFNFTHQPWPLHHIPVESSVNRTITKHI